jgi:hypothetical protein
MKKSQRLRLSALLAKGSTLTAAEQLEVNWLNALASANPDSSKDEDDSPSGFRVALMEAVAGRKTLGADLTTARARITELEGQLAAKASPAAATLPEGALAASDVAALKAQLTAANEKLTAAVAQLTVFGSALGMKADDVSGKSETEVRTAVEKRLGALAGEKIAELGFPENKLPASSSSGNGNASGDTLEDLQSQLATEKDPKKAGELAAKANALRDQKWGIKPGNN